MTHYRAVLQSNELNARAHNNLGLLYRDKGLLDEAVRHFQRALLIDPRYVTARNNLGVALLGLGRSTRRPPSSGRCSVQQTRGTSDALVNLALVETVGRAARCGDGDAGAGARSGPAERGRPTTTWRCSTSSRARPAERSSTTARFSTMPVRSGRPGARREVRVQPANLAELAKVQRPYDSRLCPKSTPCSRKIDAFPRRRSGDPAPSCRDPAIYDRAAANPEAFWADFARELEWIRPWNEVVRWNSPNAQWFVGGKLNASVNCLDRHVRTARRNKAALIWEGEPGDRRTLTYWDLLRQVGAFANVLKSLGVKKGDRVALYLPLIPELAIAMLACARIGAVHSVVFGGFSAESLRDRINDAQAVLLVTADGGYRRGQVVPLKQMADEALRETPSIKNVVVVQRQAGASDSRCDIKEGRDHWYHRLMQHADARCEPEPMDAEDMLYILYTSGTTGKPKGIVHTTGGYLVGTYATTKWVFDLKEDDVYWCTADIGWVTGHSYVVYGPLANGATVVDVRGCTRLAPEGSFLGADRALRRHDPLHRADGDSRVHAVGDRVAGQARPEHAASPRFGG